VKKRDVLIIVISAAIIILIAIIILAWCNKPAGKSMEDCKTLAYNGDNKINMVLFADEKQAKKYSQFISGIFPFSAKDFNFYCIDSYTSECELYKDTALLCYSKELVKKASSCPNDYIVVLKEKSSKIRSSSYMNVLSINLRHPLTVLPHEFGHAFANLAEEYSPATLPQKQENCKDSCDKFSVSDGCFKGCSDNNYFRSINSGIMRTLSSNSFGLFNSNLISEKIDKNENSKISGNAVQEQINCENQEYYLIEGVYSNGSIKIKSESVERGCVNGNGAGSFEYALITENGSITSEFNPELIFTDSPAEDGTLTGEIYKRDGNFFLKLPIIENVKSLKISNGIEDFAEVALFPPSSLPCKK